MRFWNEIKKLPLIDGWYTDQETGFRANIGERVTNRPRDLRRLRESNAVYRQRSNRVAWALIRFTLIFGLGLMLGLMLHDAIAAGAARVGGWR